MRIESKPVKIKATLMWASLDKVNPMSGDYQVELCELSPAAVAALEEIGVEARKRPDKPEKGFFITAKSKYPIRAYDPAGDEIHAAVGNGSKGTAVIGSYEWTFKNKKGVSASIKKLVVTDIVEYQPETKFADVDAEEAL
jgi:hypothetical protein